MGAVPGRSTRSLAVMSALSRLEMWFAAQCNGEWEHASGVSITSCDNPGWWVKIDLAGTSVGHRSFAEVSEGVDSERNQTGPHWMNCRIEGSIWHGAGDETKLERILETFLEWAERHDS